MNEDILKTILKIIIYTVIILVFLAYLQKIKEKLDEPRYHVTSAEIYELEMVLNEEISDYSFTTDQTLLYFSKIEKDDLRELIMYMKENNLRINMRSKTYLSANIKFKKLKKVLIFEKVHNKYKSG